MSGINSTDFIGSPRQFRLGTTSFIIPDHIIPNVKKLGSFFDEIELLVFESLALDSLPSKGDVKTLLSLSRDLNLTYNIHLPTDVSLSDESSQKRQAAADTLLKVLDRFAPLNPSTHTLHLEMPRDLRQISRDQNEIRTWIDFIRDGLCLLLPGVSDLNTISVETLDYPLFYIESLIKEFHLSVCLDVGHQILYNHNPVQTFGTHKLRIPLIHLHGVEDSGKGTKDHKALDTLPQDAIMKIIGILETFRGVVSLEVFNIENLNRSLVFLSQYFQDIPSEIK